MYFHFPSSLSISHLPVKDCKIIKGFIIFLLYRELLIYILGRQRYSLVFMTYPIAASVRITAWINESSPHFVGTIPALHI